MFVCGRTFDAMNTSSDCFADGDDDSDAPYQPTEEEVAQMRAATALEGQAVDAMILRECSNRWQKVAKIVGDLLDEFDSTYGHLPLAYLQARMQKLEDLGKVEIAGDLWAARFSEIRLVDPQPKVK
jgi:hypothetical protein